MVCLEGGERRGKGREGGVRREREERKREGEREEGEGEERKGEESEREKLHNNGAFTGYFLLFLFSVFFCLAAFRDSCNENGIINKIKELAKHRKRL